ncbi:MAG: hypothetical protein IKS10_08275 [Lachnospiraceae bacterium]|nr:hypothetical protein [Lachnospiraceae bacterium]
MKNEEFYEILGDLDAELVEEAEKTFVTKKSVKWLPIAVGAAAAVLLFVGGFFLFKHLGGSQSGPTLIVKHISPQDADGRNASQQTEIYRVPHWEEMEDTQRYSVVEYNGTEYTTKLILVHTENVGVKLGDGRVSGADQYAEQTHELPVAIYAIRGIAPKIGVCIAFPDAPDRYFGYVSQTFVPKDLQEFIDTMSLHETLTTGLVYMHERAAEGQVVYEDVPTSLVWDILFADTSVTCETKLPEGKKLLSISTNVNVIGVHNLAITLTEDGWLWTNVPDYVPKAFYIGQECVQRFRQEVEKNYQGYCYIYDFVEDGKTGAPEVAPEDGTVTGETVIWHSQVE